MGKLTITITTFSKRYEYVEKLIKQIRNFTDLDIILSINGDYKEKFNEEYRIKILNLSSQYPNIYPIFFPEQRGLSKIWNTSIIHSSTDWCLLLNDDIEIHSNDVFEFGKNLESEPQIIRVNGSFSHFFVHKDIINDLGYFDERLLGFGEEDGDIFFRHIEKYGTWVRDVYLHGLNNLVIDVRDENIKSGNGKYSAFNRDFCFMVENPKYVADDNGIQACFGYKMRKNLPDLQLYPYEKFFKENKEKL